MRVWIYIGAYWQSSGRANNMWRRSLDIYNRFGNTMSAYEKYIAELPHDIERLETEIARLKKALDQIAHLSPSANAHFDPFVMARDIARKALADHDK